MKHRIDSVKNRTLRSFSVLRAYFTLPFSPKTVPSVYPLFGVILKDFFFLQFFEKWHLTKIPVVHVDHPLDQKVPFTPERVDIYFDFINIWIRRPLNNMVTQMQANRTIDPAGAKELRFVTDTYNAIFEENRRTHQHLTHGNLHDSLTGLYNRTAYNTMRQDLDMSHNALLLVDVDKFKAVNDTYGHDVGDMVLKRVANVLQYSFRATDLVFRLGGDEFVVIMVNANSTLRELVRTKIEQANVMLQKPTDDLPPVSLSVGVAFADRQHPEGDIFKDADTALYRVKEAGRNGCYIY